MNLFRSILSRIPRFDITNAAGDVFMRRYKLVQTRWGNVYLHEFLRSDEDLCLHDHPWSFTTIILAGGYREQMAHGTFWRRPGSVLIRPARTAHRIEVDRPAWSLVFTGRKWRAWGFFTRFGWRAFRVGQDRPTCEMTGEQTAALHDSASNGRGAWSIPFPRFDAGRAGRLLACLGAAFWVAETWWFGWNLRSMSPTEALCDRIAFVVMAVGFLSGWRVIPRGRRAA